MVRLHVWTRSRTNCRRKRRSGRWSYSSLLNYSLTLPWIKSEVAAGSSRELPLIERRHSSFSTSIPTVHLYIYRLKRFFAFFLLFSSSNVLINSAFFNPSFITNIVKATFDGVGTMQDYDEAVSFLGTWGPFQKRLLLLLSLGGLPGGYSLLCTIFLLATPSHHCRIPEHSNLSQEWTQASIPVQVRQI